MCQEAVWFDNVICKTADSDLAPNSWKARTSAITYQMYGSLPSKELVPAPF